jgi:hypothetical protein
MSHRRHTTWLKALSPVAARRYHPPIAFIGRLTEMANGPRLRFFLTGGLESWRIALMVTGLVISFGGIFIFGWLWGPAASTGRDIAMVGVVVIGLLVVLAGFVGSQTSTPTADAEASGGSGGLGLLALFPAVGLPVLLYVTKSSPEWKVILAAGCVGSLAAIAFFTRRRT